MVAHEEMEAFIRGLLRGYQSSFEECNLIMMACSYKRAIPTSFWNDEKRGFYGILGLKGLNRPAMVTMKEEVIERIIKEINLPTKEYSEEGMWTDNYTRLFHALAILRVSKKDGRVRVPMDGEASSYAVAYNLWRLDNGCEEKYQYISAAAWNAAEVAKRSIVIF